MAKFGRRGFTRSSLIDRKAHCVEAARSCQMLSRVITKQHHETVLIQCLNAMVGITRSKVIFRLKRYLGTTLTKNGALWYAFKICPHVTGRNNNAIIHEGNARKIPWKNSPLPICYSLLLPYDDNAPQNSFC